MKRKKGRSLVENKKGAGSQNLGASYLSRSNFRYAASRLLSVLYALVLVLLGVAFPVTDILTDNWMNKNVVGVSTHAHNVI